MKFHCIRVCAQCGALFDNNMCGKAGMAHLMTPMRFRLVVDVTDLLEALATKDALKVERALAAVQIAYNGMTGTVNGNGMAQLSATTVESLTLNNDATLWTSTPLVVQRP